MRADSRSAHRISSLAGILIGAVLCLAALGCSDGDSGGANSGIPGEQRYRGSFVDNRGAPLAGLPVVLVPNGGQGATDAGGVVEILTDTLLSGDIELRIGGAGHDATITLFGIRTDAKVIFFNVSFDQGARRAAVTSLSTAPLRPDSIAIVQSCQECHGVYGEPKCTDKAWLNIHEGLFECSGGVGGPAGSASGCGLCHGDRGGPQCDNPTWQAIHVSYPCTGESGMQNTGSWQCTSCHEDRGHAECTNAAFEASHPFVSCERGPGYPSELHCNSCHALETRPQCYNAEWRRTHDFWSCGNGSSSCSSCHSYKGSPQCNNPYWRQVHASSYSCGGGPTCSECHSNKIDTECDDSHWKSIHNFVDNNGKTGGTDNLCSSCHDNDRGEAQCGDATWEAFHCFCG